MPELPEVETIRTQLEPILVDKKIIRVDIIHSQMVYGQVEKILGQTITGVFRRGKILILTLRNGYRLLVHLKMTGQLLVKNAANRKKEQVFVTGSHVRYGAGSAKKSQAYKGSILLSKHTHAIFFLSRRTHLYYNDVRKFGWVKIIGPKELVPFLEKLGPEPLVDLDAIFFQKLVRQSKRAIKFLLMDQTKVAGIGNIYANEALFCAKIHPQVSGENLTRQEASRLLKCVKQVLRKGIKYGGASQSDYVDTKGEKGRMQEHFMVYDRERKLCLRHCGGTICRISQLGRSSFFCSMCQKK